MTITADRWTSEAGPFQPDAMPIHVGLLAIAAETDRVARMADGLQAALSPLIRQGGLPEDVMQSLDDVTQSLQGLSAYVEAVAGNCPTDWRCDFTRASAQLSLHAQKLRLLPQAASVDVSHSALPNGEPEFW